MWGLEVWLGQDFKPKIANGGSCTAAVGSKELGENGV